MNVDTSDKKQQRNFGLVMAAAITALGLIRWALHAGHAPMPFFYVAGAFLVTGIAVPRALRPVLIIWLKFAEALNRVVTRVLLSLVFFLLILPMSTAMRLFDKDPLNRKWDPDAASYWEEPEEQPDEFERYLNQF